MKGNANGYTFICRSGVQPRFLFTACGGSHLTASSPGRVDAVCWRASSQTPGVPGARIGMQECKASQCAYCLLSTVVKQEDQSCQKAAVRQKKSIG